ncbi:DNA polymerase, partial [Enterobacter hormaechei]
MTSSCGNEVTLTLTSIDLELFFKHYDVYNIVWHGGWKFKSTTKIFKEYIDKRIKEKIEIKENGNKAVRTLAKLIQNA